MIYFNKEAVVNGASCIGNSHIALSIPNQDSYIVRKTLYGVMMCVCDGVGSEKYSDKGSKAACRAVFDAFKLYSLYKLSKERVGDYILKAYKRNIKLKYKPYVSTTCLFVFVLNDGRILIGQSGDGIILIKKDSKLIVFQNKTDDFMNEVCALSIKLKSSNFKIRNLKFDPMENNRLSFLLSTDGISEDVIPEYRESFMDYFINLYDGNNHALFNKLKYWDAPGSVDDKTVITFDWRS